MNKVILHYLKIFYNLIKKVQEVNFNKWKVIV